jgi:hypothetical protein
MKDAARPGNGTAISDEEVENCINEFFNRNYDLIRQDGTGHVLAEGAKRQALTQSLLYWRKLKAIATSVTETEVTLALADLTTPKGRPFVLQGIVDIVHEGDQVWMYDLKTHEESEVRAEPKVYEAQLNVYAHIWKGIGRQQLDGTAIIATRLPVALRNVLLSGSPDKINTALSEWDPVVNLPFDEKEVERTIEDFSQCVDSIEDSEFGPPAPEVLAKPRGSRHEKPNGNANSQGRTPTFAQVHCRDCDARFSCASYRKYQKKQPGASRSKWWTRSAPNENAERELDAWIEENLGDE